VGDAVPTIDRGGNVNGALTTAHIAIEKERLDPMSRSNKKPYGPLCAVGKGKAMREQKRQYNRELRRILNSNFESAYMKKPKLFHQRWSWPDDGKCEYEIPKGRRK